MASHTFKVPAKDVESYPQGLQDELKLLRNDWGFRVSYLRDPGVYYFTITGQREDIQRFREHFGK